MTRRFEDQVAVITGAASGIGKATAVRLAREGARVIACDMNEAALGALSQESLSAGAPVVTHRLDVTDESAVKALYDELVAAHGRLDVVVNSAGIVGPTATRAQDYPTDAFRKVLEVNLVAAFTTTKLALPHMETRKYGRIVQVASISGKDGNPNMAGYTASKAGLIGLVKGLGKEVAKQGITINAVAPAVIATPMNADTAPATLAYMLDKIPMGRLGTADEVAAVIAFAASPEASFCTGFVFDASGGRAVY